MSKDDVISVALMLWHHPGMRESVPKEIAEGWNVTEQNKSRSILLNIMQKGLEPTAVREDVGAFGNEPNRTSTTHTAMLPPPRKAGAGAGDGADGVVVGNVGCVLGNGWRCLCQGRRCVSTDGNRELCAEYGDDLGDHWFGIAERWDIPEPDDYGQGCIRKLGNELYR